MKVTRWSRLMGGISLTTPMIRWSCSSRPAVRVTLANSSYWSDQMVSPAWVDPVTGLWHVANVSNFKLENNLISHTTFSASFLINYVSNWFFHEWENQLLHLTFVRNFDIVLSLHVCVCSLCSRSMAKHVLICIKKQGGACLKMMKHGNSWYFNWVITRFMPSILFCITADIRLHQLIEALSMSFGLFMKHLHVHFHIN